MINIVSVDFRRLTSLVSVCAHPQCTQCTHVHMEVCYMNCQQNFYSHSVPCLSKRAAVTLHLSKNPSMHWGAFEITDEPFAPNEVSRLVCSNGSSLNRIPGVQDTESLYTRVQQEICERFGKEFTWSLKAKMMGRTALPACQVLIDELQLHGKISAEEFVKEREEKLHKLFPLCQLMPGAQRLVKHLKDCGVHIAVATSSHRRHFELKTQQHKDLFALFDHVVTGDEVQHGKPAPEIFQIAAGRWSAPPLPEACLVFEDAPVGVQAALAAHMHVVWVPDKRLDRSQSELTADVISSLEDFEPTVYGMPDWNR
jgi:HAD superfamily hydrolase (TIGR01509 family)